MTNREQMANWSNRDIAIMVTMGRDDCRGCPIEQECRSRLLTDIVPCGSRCLESFLDWLEAEATQ